ncbi:spore coat U domain-containing protein [Serratia sp. N21D137]|uniref:Csu type fimbrial protein n=1 Tax=Serratia sp. N21D137 TaxID=3397495 RepID=UPI0039DFA939
MHPLNFIVSAFVPNSCKIMTEDIDFGQSTLIDTDSISAKGEIVVSCTSDTQYNISLRSVDVNSNQFYMRPTSSIKSNNERIAYHLYRDSAKTLLWSDSGNEKLEHRTAGKHVYPIYGQVFIDKKSPFRSGHYQDTVIVTLTF